ncbi:MAG: biotin/lipoyl-binding protein [Streptosporangiaceae bacterium]
MRISGGTRRIAVIAVAVVIAGGGAGAAYAAMSSSGPAYRLTTVTSADVTANLNEDGTLTPGQQADLAFTVSGTVATVDVSAGQQVTAGQTLGTLDSTLLTASLTAARSALANANLKVANDIASQDNAASGPTGSLPSQPSASSPASSLAPLQQAVLNSQHKADAALALAKTAETQANQACTPSPAPSESSSSQGRASAKPDLAKPDLATAGHLRCCRPAPADRRDRGAEGSPDAVRAGERAQHGT